MNLIQLSITASPTDHPNAVSTFTWKDGDPLDDLICAIDALQAYLLRRQNQLSTALASQQPLPIT